MDSFETEEELRGFLAKINPVYSAYSGSLFKAGVNQSSIIGNTDVDKLASLDIPRLHATDLIAKCKATGTLLFPLMLRHMASTWRASSIQHVTPALDHKASKEGLGLFCPQPASRPISIHTWKVPLAALYHILALLLYCCASPTIPSVKLLWAATLGTCCSA